MSHTPTAPTGSIPVLDLEGACEFLELSRAEIMVLVPQALIEIRDKYALAQQNILSGDHKTLTRHAHTIKSVAASIGAETVRQTAESLEKNAHSPEAPNLTKTLGNQIETLAETITNLPS